MNFTDWRNEIVGGGIAYGNAAQLDLSQIDDKHRDQWLAGAAAVIAHRGEDWCRQNPRQFNVDVMKQLSTWVRVGLFIARIVGFSNPFLTVAAWLLPVLLEWLQERFRTVEACGSCAEIVWSDLASEAKSIAFRNT